MSIATPANPNPNPNPDQDNLLLTLFLEGRASLPEIATELGITILQLVDALEQTHIRRALARLRKLSRLRARCIADHSAPAAARTLADLAALEVAPPTSPLEVRHNETVRKAAGRLLPPRTRPRTKPAPRSTGSTALRAAPSTTSTSSTSSSGTGVPPVSTSAPPRPRNTPLRAIHVSNGAQPTKSDERQERTRSQPHPPRPPPMPQ